MNRFRKEIVGVDVMVPLIGGGSVEYANLDNSASTPSLKRVLGKVNRFMEYYSSVHRGTGFKSMLSTHFYERARETAGEFVGYDPDEHLVIFGKNSTEAINKISFRMDLPREATVIVSEMEHHSNDLPWRDKAKVVFTPLRQDGTIDIDSFKILVNKHKENLFLVAISGASNVTGQVNPIGEIAEMTHDAGAYLLVDATQLVPHRKLEMGDSIDIVAYSAHKMYAPFGTGVLVAKKKLLNPFRGPEYRGGGTVAFVGKEQIIWTRGPEADEAGSPNVVGAVALAEAINFYREVGYDEIGKMEKRLLSKLVDGLGRIEGVELYGSDNLDQRLAVVPFNVKGVPHNLVASILSHEFGIGVRSGCFCAQNYVRFLLGVGEEESMRAVDGMIDDDVTGVPGMVRASIGLYNEDSEIERLVSAVKRISEEDLSGRYEVDRKTGEYKPRGYKENFDRHFSI